MGRRAGGRLLAGINTVLNELFAYLRMSQSLGVDPSVLPWRSALLAASARCGFANFAPIKT